MQQLRNVLRGFMLNHIPFMINCREFEEFIVDYIEGELPSKQVRIFELHLKVCRECREYLEAYKRTMSVSKRSFELSESVVDPASVPEDLIAAVIAAKIGNPN